MGVNVCMGTVYIFLGKWFRRG